MTVPTLQLLTAFSDLTPYAEEPRPTVTRGAPLATTGYVAEAARLENVLLNNVSRDLDPTNTAGPFFGDLRPKISASLVATWGEAEYFAFDGRSEGFAQTYPNEGVDQYVEFSGTDWLEYLANEPINLIRPAEKTGARIQAVLDAVGVPAAILTDIAPGMSTVYAQDLRAVSALSHLSDVAQVEYGEFCYDPLDTTIRFRDRPAIATDVRSTEVQAEYVQAGGLDFIDAQRAQLPLINYVTVTYGPDGRQVTVSDAVSIGLYDRQDASISLPFETESQARCYGRWLLLMYAQPREVFTSVTFEPLNEPGDDFDLWADLLGRREGDLVRVTLDPLNAPGTLSGDPIIESASVRGLEFDFDQGRVTLGLQPSWVDGLFHWDASDLDGDDFYGL